MALYNGSLALLTDLYQLTMAYGYWKAGVADRETVFHLFFRRHPFGGGFSVVCGLEYVIDFLAHFQFAEDDLAYLATLTGNDDKRLFDDDFLGFLRDLRFDCDVDAAPEGTVVFPHEPLVRVRGKIIPCQILETPLLNMINFQTLIATKAARICLATGGDPVLEFGLRRAQGIDGALAASRAAYIGGCSATSNLLAGKYFDIPVKGTHAHSWVMCFDDEMEAFEAYAKAMPNNCVFLVDTYDTLKGVERAIEVGKGLRERGHELIGVRLDSGDLAFLSIQARRMLDEAGFENATVVASNDLDEHIIASLKTQGATIGVWGVGTKLATAYDQPAMGGVYKLSAVRKPGEDWRYKVKLSEQAVKVSNPGIQQTRRFMLDGEFIGDMVYDEPSGVTHGREIVDPMDMTRRKVIPPEARHMDLLVPVTRGGALVYEKPAIHAIRDHAMEQLSRFHGGVKRFVHPHEYPVGLERGLFEERTRLILETRGLATDA
jgi:nicotinate phosphoribosyltransferase